MSVLSKHHTIPAQRSGERIDLDAPAPRRSGTPVAAPRDSRRLALLLAAGAVVVAAGIGTAAYVVLDDDAGTATTTTVDIQSENRRDAATAARNEANAGTAATEAQRDAAAAARHASK